MRQNNGLRITWEDQSIFSQLLNLLARILLSAVFIVFGITQFTNIGNYISNPAIVSFASMTGGILSPPVLAYIVSWCAIDLFGGILFLLAFKRVGLPWFWSLLLRSPFCLFTRSGRWTVRRERPIKRTSIKTLPSSVGCFFHPARSWKVLRGWSTLEKLMICSSAASAYGP